MTREEALAIWLSEVCECGTAKHKMASFCGNCLSLLPSAVRKGLDAAQLGRTYEQLHEQARIIIKSHTERSIERNKTGENEDE